MICHVLLYSKLRFYGEICTFYSFFHSLAFIVNLGEGWGGHAKKTIMVSGHRSLLRLNYMYPNYNEISNIKDEVYLK